MDVAAVTIAMFALIVSGVTFWLTLIHRGRIKMTQPTSIFLSSDGSHGPAKVFLRTTLHCTSRRGLLVEGLFVRVKSGSNTRSFDVWLHGDDRLVRGGGVFVPHEGVSSNHHFLLQEDDAEYSFIPGEYEIGIYADTVGNSRPILLSTEVLRLTDDQADRMQKTDTGILFVWKAASRTYGTQLVRNVAAEMTYALRKDLDVKRKDLRP